MYLLPRKYEPVSEVLYQNIIISNVELERMKRGALGALRFRNSRLLPPLSLVTRLSLCRHLLDLHVKRQKPMLLVGVAGALPCGVSMANVPSSDHAGTGKTTIVKDYLAEVWAGTVIVGQKVMLRLLRHT